MTMKIYLSQYYIKKYNEIKRLFHKVENILHTHIYITCIGNDCFTTTLLKYVWSQDTTSSVKTYLKENIDGCDFYSAGPAD